MSIDAKLRKLKDEAAAQTAKGKHEKALKIYQKYLQLEPGDINILRKTADLQRRIGHKRKALEIYEKVAKLYARDGYLLQAIAVCKVILQINPGHSETQEMLAELYGRRYGSTPSTPGAPTTSGDEGAVPASADSDPLSLSEKQVFPETRSGETPPPEPAAATPPATTSSDDGASPMLAISISDVDSIELSMDGPASIPPPADKSQPEPEPEAESEGDEGAAALGLVMHSETFPSLQVPDLSTEDGAPPPALDVDIASGDAPSISIDAPDASAFSLDVPPPSEPEAPPEPPAADTETEAPLFEVDEAEPEAQDAPEPPPAPEVAPEPPDPPETNDGAEAAPPVPPPPPVTHSELPAVPPPPPVTHSELPAVDAAPAPPPPPPAEVHEATEGFEETDIEIDFDAIDEEEIEELEIDDVDIQALDPDALPHIPLFSDLNKDAFLELIDKMTLADFLPEEAVIREGDEGDSLFAIIGGTVRVTKRIGGKEVELARLSSGAFFGEMALISDSPRSASVFAVDDVELFELSKGVIDEVVRQYPSVRNVLLKFHRERMLLNLMGTSPLFRPFKIEERRELLRRFRARTFEPGVSLLEEGKHSDALYLIMAGEATVTKTARGGGDAVVVGALKEGDIFGEASLLTHRPTTASVTTRTPTTVLRLSRNVFNEVILSHPQFLEYVSDLAEHRLKVTRSLLANPDTAGETDGDEVPVLL